MVKKQIRMTIFLGIFMSIISASATANHILPPQLPAPLQDFKQSTPPMIIFCGILWPHTFQNENWFVFYYSPNFLGPIEKKPFLITHFHVPMSRYDNGRYVNEGLGSKYWVDEDRDGHIDNLLIRKLWSNPLPGKYVLDQESKQIYSQYSNLCDLIKQ